MPTKWSSRPAHSATVMARDVTSSDLDRGRRLGHGRPRIGHAGPGYRGGRGRHGVGPRVGRRGPGRGRGRSGVGHARSDRSRHEANHRTRAPTGRSHLQAKEGADMAYEVPDLPYDYGALEPHIDEQTMRIHHDKHHQAYVDKANGALEGTEWADKPVEEVLKNLDSLPDDIRTAVRNNAGGHANHTFFWQIMSPDGGGEPDSALASAIDEAFGNFDAFKDELKQAGVNQFGSGWAWLV